MWVVVLQCAVGIACGLTADIRGNTPHTTEAECKQAGELAIELAHLEKRRFVIRCEQTKD